MSFQSPWIAVAGVLLCIAAFWIARVRRVDLPHVSLWLLFLASACIALAAGQPRWNRPRTGVVEVLVDLSPSTRTADYRRRGRLQTRVAELLGGAKYHLEFFADGLAGPDLNAPTLADVPCEKTVLPTPNADAVLLFTDGRFALPEAAPPTYLVIDPALEQPVDGAVTRVEIRGNQAVASLRNSGTKRALTVIGAADPAPSAAPVGSYVIDRALHAGAASVTAQLSAGDAWPENDALSAIPLPPSSAERWWVGASGPGKDWKWFTPEQLPADAGAYLASGVIVLDNISAMQLDAGRQQRLWQYVNELGGGMLIRGGNHAFGAGRYLGSTLETLSPLASAPPRPTMRWSLLVDGSGSMSGQSEGGTRWASAIAAMADLLPHLPPEDLADVGSFAQTLTWWSQGKSVRQTVQLGLATNDVYPHGPTNLEPALLEIASGADGTVPRQLLLLSDGDVQIDKPVELIEALRQKRIHLHVLAIGSGSGLPALRQIAAATDGAVVGRIDSRQWAAGAQELLGSAMPSNFEHSSAAIQFENELIALAPRTISAWNRVWLKNGAREFASANASGMRVPLAAKWNVGEGRVAAAAFDAGNEEIEALAKLVIQPPRDPRLTVIWKIGSTLDVSVDAIEGKKYLNDQNISLRLLSTASTGEQSEQAVPQTEPGRYVLDLPAPRSPAFAEVLANGRVIDRLAVSGRYAPEFDEIGNDHAAMRTLADRSGGELITPAMKHPIDFKWPRQSILLSSWFAALGSLFAALGLIVARASRPC